MKARSANVRCISRPNSRDSRAFTSPAHVSQLDAVYDMIVLCSTRLLHAWQRDLQKRRETTSGKMRAPLRINSARSASSVSTREIMTSRFEDTEESSSEAEWKKRKNFKATFIEHVYRNVYRALMFMYEHGLWSSRVKENNNVPESLSRDISQ